MAQIDLDVRVRDRTAVALAQIERRLKTIERNTSKVSTGFGNAAKIAKGFVAVLGAREVLQFGKRMLDTVATFEQYRNQLRLITNGQEDLERVFSRLTQVAQNNRTEFGATVDLFTKLRVTTEALGVSEERVINVTGKLSKALQLAGADGNTAASVIRQFGQAMASGEVRGDEFRSLVEGLGPALAIMARESGITVGQLRKMSQAGELTAEALFEMLENSTALEDMFGKTQPTLSQLEIATRDAFDRAVVSITENIGLADIYNKALREMKSLFDGMAGIEDPFEDATLEFLRNQEGIGNIEKALEELNDQYRSYMDMGPADLFFNTKEAMGLLTGETHAHAKAIQEVIQELQERLELTHQQNEANEKLKEQYEEEVAAAKKVTDSISQHNKSLEAYKKIDIRSELEKATDEFNNAFQVVMDLRDAQGKLNLETEAGQAAYDKIEENIKLAQKALTFYGNEMDEIREKSQGLDETIKVFEDLAKANERLIVQDLGSPLEQNRRKFNQITKAINTTMKAMKGMDLSTEENIEVFNALKSQIPDLVASLGLLDEEYQKLLDMESPFFDFVQHIEEQGDAMKQLGRLSTQVYDQMADRLTDFVMTGKFNFADFSRFVIRELIKIAVQAAITFAINSIAGAFGIPLPGRASGGPVEQGRPYVVGEEGPELFVPGASGRIVPNDALKGSQVSSSSGEQDVIINFNITATDAASFDDLLVSRRSTIVGIINEGMNRQGKRSLM